MSDPTHNVQETADKIEVKTKIKRGTGTRDQDTINVRVRGSDPETVAEKLASTTDAIRGTVDDVREMQPGDPNE